MSLDLLNAALRDELAQLSADGRTKAPERVIDAVVPAAIRRSAGLDLVEIGTGGAARTVTVVPGPVVATPDGPMVEILSGLRSGDTVILP